VTVSEPVRRLAEEGNAFVSLSDSFERIEDRIDATVAEVRSLIAARVEERTACSSERAGTHPCGAARPPS
jgi:hypothetical protein